MDSVEEKAWSVLVIHSGRQHSHQIVLALLEKGWLAEYWTGIPCLESHKRFFSERLWRRLIKYALLPLPETKVRWMPIAPLIGKISERIPNPKIAKRLEYYGYWLFDKWAAYRLKASPMRFDAIIGYENSTRETFKVAKRLGITTILDAASLHHTAQDELHPYYESAQFHHLVTARKDSEIDIADHILTASNLARDTYLAAGVHESKVTSLMLGADIDLFRPNESARKSDVFTIIFVGITCYRKGIDILLEAFQQVIQSHKARLRIIGAKGDCHHLIEQTVSERITYEPVMSQQDLAVAYQESDCFVLPSRNDSYGMVVAEAMACGLPVIVSDMVGSKDLIEPGLNGWVVSVENTDFLARQMLACLDMGRQDGDVAAQNRKRAESASWESYRGRFIEYLDRTLRSAEGNR